jgi:hypothetical protein
MSEKEKGKAHPFAGHLRPTEEVLWMSVESRYGAFWRHACATGNASYVPVFVTIAIVFLMFGWSSMPPFMLAIVVLTLVIAGSSMVFLVWGTQRLIKGPASQITAYAVTNERLLYRSQDRVLDVSLEHIGDMLITRQNNNRATLIIGFRVFVNFVTWLDLDIEAAAAVKQIIQDARWKYLTVTLSE